MAENHKQTTITLSSDMSKLSIHENLHINETATEVEIQMDMYIYSAI